MKLNIFGYQVRTQRVKNEGLPVETLAGSSFDFLKTLKHYHNDNYENGYSSIRAIADRFFLLRPYAVDDKGERLKQSPNVIDCLSRPNQQMSGFDFRDALAVMSMVHDKTFILVWERRNGEVIPATESVREETVAGFTFLEDVQEQVIEGKLQYRVGANTIFYPHQVIALYDVNPGNLLKGYSPSKAAKRWTRIDDYIADYQTGFFENGAIPSGQFIITAPTVTEYNDIVDKMQEKHQGARKNNNVMYSYAPIDKTTGKPAQATITWVPFNVTNKDMSLKDLFTQANHKIDSVYRVSAFIRAIDEAPNFATAQVIERNFVENTVRPFAIKKWARFQHELNRIVGGLGYGISFHLETPGIAEEDKYVAETNVLTVSAINSLVTAGYTLDSAIEALGLDPRWKKLARGAAGSTAPDEDNPDVDEGGESDVLPDQNDPLAVASIPKKILSEAAKGNSPKAPKQPAKNELTDQQELEAIARRFMQSQVDKAVDEFDQEQEDDNPSNSVRNEVTGAPDPAEEDKFVDDMLTKITGIMVAEGAIHYEEGKELILQAGLNTDDLDAFVLSDDARDAYQGYLRKVGQSYGNDTAESIRAVLATSNVEGWNAAETKSALRNIMNTDEWRVVRLGGTELNRSLSLSGVEAMKQIQNQTGATIEKALTHDDPSNMCEFCAAINDQWTKVDQPLVGLGETIEGTEGGVFINNFVANDGYDVHPNGKGHMSYRVVKT